MKPLVITPPLLNSANPWCTTLSQLQELYDSPYTGAVTTRTSLLDGFPHDDRIHQFAFYDPRTHKASSPNPTTSARTEHSGSLNTLGYSPAPLQQYLEYVKKISDEASRGSGDEKSVKTRHKPFIISVTGSVEEVIECYKLISAHQQHVLMVLAMEINLSCPNIPDKPPPAYSCDALLAYLLVLKVEIAKHLDQSEATQNVKIHVPVGIKTPPYTYQDQFKNMTDALIMSAKAEPSAYPCPISFITATNTLGSSLLLLPTSETSTLPTSPGASKAREVLHHTLNSATGTGIGGLAGAPLHPLALGNVYTIRGMLFQHKELEHIQIIGVGGVEDVDSYQRMRAVGATAVGIGTALGRKGVQVFEEIGEALQQQL